MFPDNPFTVFTFIAAPAVLTNASALSSLTTSNRLARAVDRARALVNHLADPTVKDDPRRSFHIREVEVARQRAVLMIRAMGFFQLACGAFAAATLIALFGAVFALVNANVFREVSLLATLICTVVAVSGLVAGSFLLVRESRMAYTILREESVYVLEGFKEGSLDFPD